MGYGSGLHIPMIPSSFPPEEWQTSIAVCTLALALLCVEYKPEIDPL